MQPLRGRAASEGFLISYQLHAFIAGYKYVNSIVDVLTL